MTESDRPRGDLPAADDETRAADEEPTVDGTAAPDHAGQFSIEGYRILRELHRGGQGVVYEALELSTKRNVALKLLLGGAYASAVAQKRFEREIELVAQLEHPGIITIFGSGKTREGLTYYAMDLVRGKPLDQHVRDEDLTVEGTCRLFAEVSDAVQYAHQRGVIHRDLKPSNVLVDPRGNPKVLDFGLAKQTADTDGTALSITDQVMGTLRYMSPEQAAGKTNEIDTRTDVYSLGVMLYEVLTGRPPYPVEGQLAQILSSIIETPAKPPASQWDRSTGVTRRTARRLRAGQCPIDQDVQTIVMKALAKKRDRRYQSPGELARDLERYVAGEGIEARRDSSMYVLRTTLRRFTRRHQLLLGLSLTAVVAIAGALTLVSYKGARDRELGQTQRQARADVMVREAIAMQSSGDLAGAEKRLEESLLFAPDNFRALGNLAIVKKEAHFSAPYVAGQVDRLEEANVLCDRALMLKPDSAGVWNVKCVALYSLGRYPEGRRACNKAIDIDSGYFWAQANLARVFALEGRFDEALAAAESAVETVERRGSAEDLAAGKAWATGAWRTLGTLQLMLGDTSAATRSFESALECNSSDAWTRALIAQRLLADGKDRDPASALRNAIIAAEIATTPDERMVEVVARAALADGAMDQAAEHASECLRLDAGMTACHLILAIARAGESGSGGGREHFEAALATLGGDPGRDLHVDARRGVLWFRRHSELKALCDRAARAVGASCER